MKEEPCADSDFSCITLSVPRDHFSPGGPTWDVTFGILRSSGARKGVFVTAVGGPGESGLSLADDYTAGFPEGITEAYDVVWFDQRGIGRSRPIQCPEATAAYYGDDTDINDPAQAEAAKTDARTFVDACIAESGVDEADLPYYATRQAVEDLEAFREYLDGRSSSSCTATATGPSSPRRTRHRIPIGSTTLFLDGPVDLALEGPTTWAEVGRSFTDVLLATLTTCTADEACLAGRRGRHRGRGLGRARRPPGRRVPIEVDFVTADGDTEPRQLTLADLENVGVSYLYGPFDRMMLLRILAQRRGW